MRNSSRQNEPNTLAIRFGKRAEEMLVEFANCRPESASFARFKAKWQTGPFKWRGDHQHFLFSQRIVREIWEGKKKGLEEIQVASMLGIETQDRFADEDERISAPAIEVDWGAGQLVLVPRSLEDVVWLTLLQHSRRLGICANKNGECVTPYFLQYRKRQKFCSEVCALPAQREFKRKWWGTHGKEWKRKQQRKRGTKRPNLF